MAAHLRYCIGIDLGTTNSALSFIDTLGDERRPRILECEQLEKPLTITRSSLLPSSLYIAQDHERDGALDLPFQPELRPSRLATGLFARSQTARNPGRVIQSAKSWLSYQGVDRTSKILPWSSGAVAPDEKLSPVDAQACYLRHFRDYWNFTFSERFEDQSVCITVPASFDEAAQALTLEAAERAGYPSSVRLLEEPQAAFYFFLSEHESVSRLQAFARRGEANLLVVDIGGGTTDLSLFRVSFSSGSPVIRREAVSDHLLLGGDNIDLTLALMFEKELSSGNKLAAAEWAQLVYQSRLLKERILSGSEDKEEFFVSIAGGSGSSLFGSARSARITRRDLEEAVLDGFFPLVRRDDRPRQGEGALREFGLPYASDSAVTRHLAAFLENRRVDALLCNGGAMKPAFLRRRLQELIASWQAGSPDLLESRDLDLAVAHGAACYLSTLRGTGQKIQAGYSHNVYLELAGKTEPRLVCLVPKGAQGGQRLTLENRVFGLSLNRPVAFQLVTSRTREPDPQGALVASTDGAFHRLPPLFTKLPASSRSEKEVPVRLEVQLNETGLLRMFCAEEGGERRFELLFNLRASEEPREQEHERIGVAEDRAGLALDRISLFYGKKKTVETKESPKRLFEDLERILGEKRIDWNVPLLRLLWSALAYGVTKRGRSLAHEVTFLYLAGWLLRPGFGSDLDRFRIAELWRCFELGLSFPKENSAVTQWWIMWRRVAGGLKKEMQEQLWDSVFEQVLGGKSVSPEAVRALASLELVSKEKKEDFARNLMNRIKKSPNDLYFWSLGRLGSRTPLYSGMDSVLDPENVRQWFAELEGQDWTGPVYASCISIFAQAARLTGMRGIDIDDGTRERIIKKMKESHAPAAKISPLERVEAVQGGDREALFGERLPPGLRLLEA